MGVALLLSLVAAIATVVGGLFVVFRLQSRALWLRSFLAFGAGFLLAAGLLAMVPEAFEALGAKAALLILAGYLLTHTFEHALVPHFHFGEETHSATAGLDRSSFMAATTGMFVHSIFDGAAIGSGFAMSTQLGWLLFLAVALHKLPDGFTIASLALASQQTPRAALMAVFLLGAATLLGTALVSLWIGWAAPALALSAGVAIYVAATDLMPEVNRERHVRWSLIFFAGVVAFYLSERLLHMFQHSG
jgi:ZIP family zinc transporter/zinc and cadmium transporter